MPLSNNIREFRFQNGEMTQKRLAELVGVSRQTMNAIENSKHAPTIDIAIRIADVFGISVDDLFEHKYDGKPERRSEAAKTTTVEQKPSIEAAIDDQAEPDSAEDEDERKLGLKILQKVIG